MMTLHLARTALLAPLAAALLAACAAGPAAAQTPSAQNPASVREPLTVRSGDVAHVFQVEVADTPEETQLGLMHRTELARDHGMIFDFGEPRESSMYMKNTLIPLDMLFIDETGEIVAIAANAKPKSLRIINPGFVVKGVLEINGGLAAELGIEPGDRVEHRIFAGGE
jgi:hypothetical protein